MIAQLSNHLWQSTVFAIVVAVAAFVFRRNRAQVRYALWFAASVKFLLPFSLLVTLGSLLPLPAARADATPSTPPAFSIAVNQLADPFAVAAAIPVAPASRPFRWTPVLLVVWLSGSAAIVAIRLRAWRRIRRAVGTSTPMTLHVEQPLDVRSSLTTLEPGVVGVWRPILLVPARITDCLTPRQLETVVAHEHCHVRRRDNLTAAIHMGVEAVWWFHPLVWWIGARMLAERERACDEAVLTQGLEPRDYADAILNVCRLCVESPLACVAGVTGSNIRKRLDDIMLRHTGAALTIVRKTALWAAAIAALATPLAVGAITAPLRAQSQSQSQDQGQRFDVASIKPCDPSTRPPGRGGGPGQNLSPDRLHIACMSVVQLINVAYITNGERLLNDDPGYLQRSGDGSAVLTRGPDRVRGGPAWARDEKFEIEAKASAATDRKILQGPMLRALLEERFHLMIHRAEDQNVDMFALTVASGKPKITPWASESECTQWDRATQKPPPMKDVIEMVRRGEKPPCGLGVMGGENGSNRTLALNGQPMDSVAYWLSTAVGRHVLNRTGLEGKYTLYLEYAPQDSPADATGPSVFKAIEEQWGLKLEPTKGPRGYIAIDQVERPSNDVRQDADSRTPAQTFEAASIRPCDPHETVPIVVPLGGRGGGPALDVSPGRLNVHCITVADLVNIAYVQHGDPAPVNRTKPALMGDDTIRGGPAWVRTDKYTIEATALGAPSRSILLGTMLRSLLEDRFQLKLHQDTKQIPAFALRVADQGLKLRPVDPNTCVMPDPDHPGPRVSKMTPAGTKAIFAAGAPEGAKPFCGAAVGGAPNGPSVTYDAIGQPFDQLVRTMGFMFDRPVVNETHVDGQFTFHLEFARDENVTGLPVPPGGAPAPADPSGPTVFAAFEKQLGLKFVPAKAPQGFLVIDKVERPRVGG
jgi:uncharacterized protein (TIGR03435 family)